MSRILVLSVLLACAAVQAAETIAIAGSSAMKPLIERCAKEFQAKNPGITITVAAGGPTAGLQQLAEGKVQLATVSREVKEEEKAKIADLAITPVAGDGIVFVVHKTNPISDLSAKQVQDLYTGAAKSWKDVGGADKPVTLITMKEGYAARELFLQVVGLEDKQASDSVLHRIAKTGEFGAATAKPSNAHPETLANLIKDPQALGYVSTGAAFGAISKGAAIKALSFAGIAGSNDNITNGTYPLRRPLTLVAKGQPAGSMKAFLDFITGADGQKIVAAMDFVPLVK
jgi:phosphate transport system substrate-binding protein